MCEEFPMHHREVAIVTLLGKVMIMQVAMEVEALSNWHHVTTLSFCQVFCISQTQEKYLRCT